MIGYRISGELGAGLALVLAASLSLVGCQNQGLYKVLAQGKRGVVTKAISGSRTQEAVKRSNRYATRDDYKSQALRQRAAIRPRKNEETVGRAATRLACVPRGRRLGGRLRRDRSLEQKSAGDQGAGVETGQAPQVD